MPGSLKIGSTSHAGNRIYLVLRRQGLGSTFHVAIRMVPVLWRAAIFVMPLRRSAIFAMPRSLRIGTTSQARICIYPVSGRATIFVMPGSLKIGSTSHVGNRIYLVLRRQGFESTSHAAIRMFPVL